MGRFRVVMACVLAAVLAAPAGTQQAAPASDDAIMGFSASGSRTQRDWEQKFRAIPSTDNLREYMRRLSARPHHLGSPYDKENAEWMLAKFKEWGWDAQIETFNVLFPTPLERVVELVEPTKYTLKLAEPVVAEDPTSNQQAEQLPIYNAYSIDGEATAPLVYVNYGAPADFERLDRMGISVKGAIVIARYGQTWRGIKPKVAAERGAVGCLIYSDPRDDGFYQGDVFPKGAWRPPYGAQRGSVMDMPLYPGDPLTPGVGATPNAKRLHLSEVPTLTKIPVLPISYADAQPLLAALGGPVAPENWRGALPITYHVGPGPARVHMKLKFSWDRKNIYNVIAKIPGSEFPDEWILRGNHHDAWVNGADDPVSGMVAVMEEARALGELRKQGWKPRRTIVYAAWDAEEQGLIGSTEWAETHAEELRQKAVAYINTDSSGRGYLGMSGSHTLEKFINGVARDITDPQTKDSTWKRAQLRRIRDARNAEDRKELRTRGDLRISALGSGSDYTTFLDHLGIASLNIGFGGDDGGGIYHSIYDDFYWYTKFSDTDFTYGRALAQTGGTAVMRLASADALPFEFTNFADTVKRYVDELKKLHSTMQDEAREHNMQLEEGVFAATANARDKFIPAPAQEIPPKLDFAPLEQAVAAVSQAAEKFRATNASNAALIQSERKLTHADGLPGRPWFKHMIYAPGFYTGYGVKTLPAVREAIEQKRWAEAEREIARTARVLQEFAAGIPK